MEPYIQSLADIIKSENFIVDTSEVKNAGSSFMITWKKATATSNSIEKMTVQFAFDTQSFIAYCKDTDLQPILISDLTIGFSEYFVDLAPYITQFGTEHYAFLQDFLHKKRGGIASKKVGF